MWHFIFMYVDASDIRGHGEKDRLCPFNDILSLTNFLAAYIIICSYTPSKPPLTFHFNPLSRTAIGSIQFPAKHNSHSYY